MGAGRHKAPARPGPIRPATIPVRPQDQHALLDPLYVAQQVLAWGSDPDGFRSPYDMITDAPLKDATRTPEAKEGC